MRNITPITNDEGNVIDVQNSARKRKNTSSDGSIEEEQIMDDGPKTVISDDVNNNSSETLDSQTPFRGLSLLAGMDFESNKT